MKNRPAEYNSDATKQKRWRYVNDFALPLLLPDNCVYIDETPFALHQKRSKGWSKVGQTPQRETSKIRGANFSVIAAISPVHGLLHYMIKKTEKDEDGNVRGVGEEEFMQFSRELLTDYTLTQRHKWYFILMDNVNFHKSPAVKNLYNAKHQHMLLPPYSPFLNPIELVFAQWKRIYKGMKHRTNEEVVTAIHCSALQLRLKFALFLACYNHTLRYYDRVLNFETIDD
jgi:transposase